MAIYLLTCFVQNYKGILIILYNIPYFRFTGDICMHTDRKFDTMRGIGEILRFERGDWQGSGRGRGGRSGTRKGKHHKDF